MFGIIINGRPATEEEQELICASFVKQIFDSMTEQEKKDIADKFCEELEKAFQLRKQNRKDDNNEINEN